MALTPATPKVRKQITLRALSATKRSVRLPAYETLEIHLVHPKLGWDAAVAQAAAVSPRVDGILDDTMLDRDGTVPVCAAHQPLPAIPLDNLSVDEAAELMAQGWEMTDVVRLWPGGPEDETGGGAAHEARVQRTAARAGRSYWSYYRSTGWGFIYPKPAKRRRGR